MVCQPCAAAPSGTVLHGLMYHMVQSGQISEGSNMAAAASRLSQGIVQRLDKQTSGIMIVAKTLAASSKLSKLFKQVSFKKPRFFFPASKTRGWPCQRYVYSA